METSSHGADEELGVSPFTQNTLPCTPSTSCIHFGTGLQSMWPFYFYCAEATQWWTWPELFMVVSDCPNSVKNVSDAFSLAAREMQAIRLW